MKKTLLLASALLMCFWVSAQSEKDYGTVVNFNLNNFKTNSLQAVANNGLVSELSVDFPLYNGLTAPFVFDENLISTEKINGIQTFDAVSKDGKSKMKLTITPSGMSGIMHTPEGYFFIEPISTKNNQYRIYQSSDVKNASITCDQNEMVMGMNLNKNKNKRILSVAPFPVGTQLRTYKLAVAVTGEMTTLYGTQDAALAKIVEIANANNLIYESEASIRFELVTQTTNKSLIFTNAATDPFDAPLSVAFGQAGFVTMNTNGTLPYAAYGIGHTFNALPAEGGGSGNGVAGPTPCVDDSKSRGFTQFSLNASLSLIINIFTHEVAHQFASFHTYNAIGGDAGSSTFCLTGWNATSAIEPGSGTTMMSYANSCINPTNYTIAGNNKLQYFNTKSLEQIFTTINTAPTNSCIVSTATGNTAPVANANGASGITIPKGTPFTLNGSATDANSDPMTYTWEQYDVATENDKGALGNLINGIGGYPAVSSTTAPLFRSEQSSTSTSRTFPKITYILNNANNPADNEGEDLPQVARTMKFRFTVRDNKQGGGGVDSDEITVTVNNTGPLEVSAFNTAQTVAAGSSQTVTWNVNTTNTLVANVKILFSIDEGKTFPYVLSSSTPNNGSATVTIPANVVNTTQGRVKVTCEINSNAEFFDLNNANITVTSSCLAKTTVICSDSTITGVAGNSVLNLGLNFVTGSGIANFSKTYPTTGLTDYPIINYTDITFTTCQASSFGSSGAILVPFRVTKKGIYTFSTSKTGGGGVGCSFFTSNSTFDCTTFVGSNLHGGFASRNPRTISLNECTTYYALIYAPNTTTGIATSITFNIQSSATGEIIEVQPNQAGFNYTYVAVNQANSQITAVNATADFRTLSAGTYRVQGLSYISTFDPATLVNQTVAQAIASSSCILFSNNTKPVTVTGGTTVLPPTAASPQTRCTGQTVATLVATGTAIQWYAAPTGGTALATTTVLAAGTYYASQTVGGVEGARTVVVVLINASPTAATAGSNSPVTVGSPLNLTSSSTGGTSQVWAGPNSYTSTAQNPSIASATTAMAGVYTVTITSSGICTATATANVIVNAVVATVAPPTAANPQTRCTGQTVATLVATGTAIQWYAALTGGTALATTTVLTAGTYYASQTVGGVESTRTAVVITVNALTTPSVSISPTSVCAGVTQTITTTPTNGGTATYLWKKNTANFATTQNISITTAVAGDVYSLVMTPSVDVCPDPATPTATASLTIGPACVATITSVASGNWETAATWDLNRIPTAADVVVIAASHNVTVTTNDANAKKVETRSNGKVIFSNNTTKLKLGL
jgi:hypothetical protein